MPDSRGCGRSFAGVLTAAAVVGRDVPLELLREVAELDEEVVDGAADNVARADFLYESGLATGERRYTFRHALVQETTYAKLPPSQCRALHLRVVDAIEALPGPAHEPRGEAGSPRRAGRGGRARHPVPPRGGAKGGDALRSRRGDEPAWRRKATTQSFRPESNGIDGNWSCRWRSAWCSPPGEVRRRRRRLARSPAPESFSIGPRTFRSAGTLLIGRWYSSIQRSEYEVARSVAEQLLAFRTGPRSDDRRHRPSIAGHDGALPRRVRGRAPPLPAHARPVSTRATLHARAQRGQLAAHCQPARHRAGVPRPRAVVPRLPGPGAGQQRGGGGAGPALGRGEAPPT